VFRAYYLLKEWGLIRAQERPGYFVAPVAAIELKIASKPVAPTLSEKVDISELVFSVLDATKHPNLVPLGSAFPSPLLFPLPRLAKSLGHAARLISPGAPSLTCRRVTNSCGDKSRSAISALAFHNRLKKIVVTNGALEGLNLCLAAVTKPGDVIAVESPCFYGALQAIERLELRAVETPVGRRDSICRRLKGLWIHIQFAHAGS